MSASEPVSPTTETDEKLIVYGARCVWWDSIDKAVLSPPLRIRALAAEGETVSLPCCPGCGSVLFQVEESSWWKQVDEYESKGNEGYRAFIEWGRGKCFVDHKAAQAAYAARERTP